MRRWSAAEGVQLVAAPDTDVKMARIVTLDNLPDGSTLNAAFTPYTNCNIFPQMLFVNKGTPTLFHGLLNSCSMRHSKSQPPTVLTHQPTTK